MLQSPTSEEPTYIDIYEYTLRRIVQHPWDTAVRDDQAGAAEGRLDSFSPCVEEDLMQRATASCAVDIEGFEKLSKVKETSPEMAASILGYTDCLTFTTLQTKKT